MLETISSYHANYTAVGDIIVMATVIVFMILIQSAYIEKNKEFRIFTGILVQLFTAAAANIYFNMKVHEPGYPVWILYLLRWSYLLCLFSVLHMFVLYMGDPLNQGEKIDKRYMWSSRIILIVAVLYNIIGTFFKFGFYIQDEKVHSGLNMFPVVYIAFVSIIMIMIINYRRKVFTPILMGVISTCSMSFLVMFIQYRYGQISFTTATFLFPCYAVLYLLHSSALDVEMGSVHIGAFTGHIKDLGEAGKEGMLVSMYLPAFEEVGRKYPKEITDKIRDNVYRLFRGTTIFQISGGRTILVIEASKNPDIEYDIKEMLDIFSHEYDIYKQDYKIVITKTIDNKTTGNEYLGLIQYIETRMPMNDVHEITEKEVDAYQEYKYIVDELADIYNKKDMDDPRILVFCQPVYNIETGKFDTAEALMRMKLEKTGMVFPDKFIPIAENNGYIHALSLIILSKTCAQIRKLMEEGYYLKRISVNFSIMDVREEHFCFHVKQIVQDRGVPFDKVAIEITESQNEKDFMLIKEKLYELKQSGITFYLDDFGTGYSNFDRIMELPFDIIKFDRSLVIASAEDEKTRIMVNHLAQLFADLDYSVLYEGIENEDDEKRCTEMHASYLQGYKYSKPIPIEQLTEYFERKYDPPVEIANPYD